MSNITHASRISEIPEKNDYLNALYCDNEDEVLQNVRKSINENNLAPINISYFEAQIIATIIKMSKAKNILEIGTHAGYSTICMARELPAQGRLITLERDERTKEIAQKNIDSAELSAKITIVIGDAHKSLQEINKYINPKEIDLVFLDAEKKGYPQYLSWCLDNLVQGTVIVADNTLLKGSVADESLVTQRNKSIVAAVRQFNAKIADKELFTSTLLPTYEGLTVAVIKPTIANLTAAAKS